MNNYEQLLNELLFGAKELIGQTKNVNDKFDMTIRLAEQVRKAMKMNLVQVTNVESTPVVEKVPMPSLSPCLWLSTEKYEQVLGYSISDAAYEEYKDIQTRLANGEDLKIWIPDPDGLCPIPADVIVTLVAKENPLYKHLFEEKVEEEVGPEIEEPEEEQVVNEITDDMIDTTVIQQEEVLEMTIEEAVEKALAEDDGIEIDIDEDPSCPNEAMQVLVEIDGEELDIIDQYNLIKSFNNELTHDELVERAVDWIEFGINKETYDMLNFIEDDSAEVIQCKTYLAYYIDAMQVDGIVYYINYFASNVEEDENGEEVYVNEELQLDFLNKENISAFLEYVQQNQ